MSDTSDRVGGLATSCQVMRCRSVCVYRLTELGA